MKIKEEKQEEYAAWREKNSDPYSRRCFTYAEDWADLMEANMNTGKELEEVAKLTSRDADTDVIYGITGFMYEAAVSILAGAWEHGERLRRWHNLDTQTNNEGEQANKDGSTLNPALLGVDKK